MFGRSGNTVASGIDGGVPVTANRVPQRESNVTNFSKYSSYACEHSRWFSVRQKTMKNL